MAELVMTHGSYRQFCPVAMAAEVLCNRWALVLIRELICGSTRFNELRRGVPRMSPALMSTRLKDLEEAGIVRRMPVPNKPGVFDYLLTQSGRDLEPVVKAMGIWGQRWVDAQPSLQNLDADLLMWDMRRSVDKSQMPHRRTVIEFSYPEQATKRRHYWLVITPGSEVDVCAVDPGFDVDLYVTTDLRTMTAIWIGVTTVKRSRLEGKMLLAGDDHLASSMQSWLGLSPFAGEKKLATA